LAGTDYWFGDYLGGCVGRRPQPQELSVPALVQMLIVPVLLAFAILAMGITYLLV
jgi:hypothetical protein